MPPAELQLRIRPRRCVLGKTRGDLSVHRWQGFLVPIRLRAVDIDDAVKRLSRLVLTQINPYVMGMYEYEVDHDPAASLQILEKCADNKDYSHRPAAFNAWGSVLADLGRLDEAIAKYQKAVELDPKGAYPYNNWGNTLADQGKLDEAVTRYQKAIELYPEFTLTYSNWATTLRRQGKLGEALAKYQKAIELEPRYADAYIGWGNVLGDQGKLDEAATKYQKAIELNPKSALAYRNLALTLRQQGKADEAEANEKKAGCATSRF